MEAWEGAWEGAWGAWMLASRSNPGMEGSLDVLRALHGSPSPVPGSTSSACPTGVVGKDSAIEYRNKADRGGKGRERLIRFSSSQLLGNLQSCLFAELESDVEAAFP